MSYLLTATKTADGITSTVSLKFASFARANAANWGYQDAGYAVRLVKVS